jgi:lysophospholipase L1-like esterase
MVNQSLFQADGVHPNEAGAKLLAATIYRAVTGSEPPATPGKGN